jgi:hypothetical protein
MARLAIASLSGVQPGGNNKKVRVESMGQYYKAVTKGTKYVVYSRDVIINGAPEYTMAKLTEHSWWGNKFVEGVCKDLFVSPAPLRVAWVGDYANGLLKWKKEKSFNGLTQKDIARLHKRVWHTEGIPVADNDFSLKGLFLVNHTKKEYVACDPYFCRCAVPDDYGEVWCLHPLPLLTCIGNGLGGGDFFEGDYTRGSTYDYVGRWAWDLISIADRAPEGFTELKPLFREIA